MRRHVALSSSAAAATQITINPPALAAKTRASGNPVHPCTGPALTPTCSSSATSSILRRFSGSAQAFLLATRRVVEARMVSMTCCQGQDCPE